MSLPRPVAVPADARMLAGTMNHLALDASPPLIELYLYRLRDDAYLLEWQYLECQHETWVVTRQQVAECDTFLVVLERLATFAVAEWDGQPIADARYEESVRSLLCEWLL